MLAMPSSKTLGYKRKLRTSRPVTLFVEHWMEHL
jgi:hypothetical protein